VRLGANHSLACHKEERAGYSALRHALVQGDPWPAATRHRMAQKRKKKKGRLRTFFFFILTPLIVWFLAFLLWLFWDPITRPLSTGADHSKTRLKARRNIEQSERSNLPAEKRGQEQILDEERKKLNEILSKQRNNK
jgi:flagellar biosynthesis/type III secretory pathway M-ring protein FliF/YscJ